MRSAVSTSIELGKTKHGFGFALLGMLATCATAASQTPDSRPEISSLGPAGGQSSMTTTYGALGFRLWNPRNQELQARILTFYDGASGKQYGCDVWAPPNAMRWSWFCMGPTEHPPTNSQIVLKSVLLERAGDKQQLLRSVNDQPLITSLTAFEGHDQITTLMTDTDVSDGLQRPVSPQELIRAAELRELLQVIRHDSGLSSRLNTVRQQFLLPVPEAYEGIDQFVLASDRISADPDGRRALREWLERGGRLWIPLDLVQQKTVTDLLGDILNFQVIDRTSLMAVRFERGPGNPYLEKPETLKFDQPIDFVRVLAPEQQVFYTVDGWPAAFLTEVGRGRVLFTTLSGRAWTRPRERTDPPARYQEFPFLPISRSPLEFLAREILLRPERPLFTEADLRPYISSQISYPVVSRAIVLVVFGMLFLGLALASIVFGKRGLLEHMAWLGPTLAVGATAVFFLLGERSRSEVPPTMVVAQIVNAEPGTGDAQASGLIGVFQPGREPSTVIGAQDGGQFDLDVSDLEGTVLRRVQTDVDRWHWENLELPTGVRLAPFKQTLPIHEPMKAAVRFGPKGMEGHVESGPFHQLEDVLLAAPGRHALPVSINADGSLRPDGADSLESGHLLTSSLLSDSQRYRQSLYEKLFAVPQPRYLASRSMLLAWAEPLDMHFTLVEGARTTGTALLTIPLQFERTPPNTPVVVPGTFVECLKVSGDGRLAQPATAARFPANVKLHFQLPASVLPMTVENARLTVKLQTPLREVVISGFVDGALVPLRRMTSPIGTEKIEITDPRMLQLDPRGALYVNIEVGDARSDVEQDLWRLEWATLEVHGRTHE